MMHYPKALEFLSRSFTAAINIRLVFLILSVFGFVMDPSLNLVQANVAPLDLTDEPLMAQIKTAPANIMIVLDDSGSMTYDILVIDQNNGGYPSPSDKSDHKVNGFCYIFDFQTGDTAYQDDWRYMGDTHRKLWRSQYFADNVMYYNPHVTYRPWPSYGNLKYKDAHPNSPKRSPTTGTTLDLDETSFTVKLKTDDRSEINVNIKHAHYFDQSDSGEIYLVVIDGDRKKIINYQVIKTSGSGFDEDVKEIKHVDSADLPAGIAVKSDYQKERQNFANWFTYHRRRDYVAKNAIANVVTKLEGLRVGILAINGSVILPLQPVGVWDGGSYNDHTETILRTLYETPTSYGGTPLREGLNDVGQYYRKNDTSLIHHNGDSVSGTAPPYFKEDEGGPCQQSFAIIMTDGYYTYLSEKSIDVGNVDRDTDDNPLDGGFYADRLSNTLADVAMYYYKNDLSPDAEDSPAGDGLTDRVYNPRRLHQIQTNTAPHQHMVTYGLAFGVTGALDPAAYEDDSNSEDYLKCIDATKCELGQYPQWPNPPGGIGARSKETVDDLFHASVNGRGRFLTAKNPQSLSNALSELADNIIDHLGSSSAVATNGDALYGQINDDALIFQASYQTYGWTGDVKAYGVDARTGKVLVDDDTAYDRGSGSKWSAAETLDSKAPGDRNILSYNGESGIDFNKEALTGVQKEILGTDYANIVDFVSGNPVAGFRTRASILGDIVHSSPVFEKDVLYVGANDGMLHAFEIAVTDGRIRGDEIFAYVPNLVYSTLKFLTDPIFHHKFFVDLTPTVASGTGLLGGLTAQTILVGGLGKGGRGYFALDVTTPLNMSKNNVLWEFPNADSDEEDRNDMGYTFSKPVIVRTNSAVADETWAIITGNGYASENGRAALFILRPGKPAANPNIVIRKIVPTAAEDEKRNGLSSPIAVDVNFDQKVDFVFAGDLYGNLWKFDLTAEDASQWKVAYTDGSSDQPLFKAQGQHSDGAAYAQPITSKPEVMFHPREQGLMVLFGTGKFLGKADFYDQRTQTIYAVWDYGDRIYYPGPWGNYSNDDDGEYLGAFDRPNLSNLNGNVSLKPQASDRFSVTVNDVTLNLRAFRSTESNGLSWRTTADRDRKGPRGEPNLPDIEVLEADSPIPSHAGWYFDLPENGERVVSDVLLRDGKLIAIGFTPDPDMCNFGGDSYFMEFNSANGRVAGGTLLDINDDGLIDEKDLIEFALDPDGDPRRVAPFGIQLPGNLQLPAILQLNEKIEVKYMSSSDGTIYTVKEPAVRLGVTYWKELIQ